ncbi:hypothetical protein ASE66_28790 [Bosea sp. Root483D1]|nr:hypothetical protein ASE66_28790 [Bosea sp. Root483D1]
MLEHTPDRGGSVGRQQWQDLFVSLGQEFVPLPQGIVRSGRHAERIERQRVQGEEEAGERACQPSTLHIAHTGEIQQRRSGQFRVRGGNARSKPDDAYAWDRQRQPAGECRKGLRFLHDIATRVIVPGKPNDQLPGVEREIVLSALDDDC